MKSLVTVYLLVTLLDQSLVINCDGDHHHDHGDARNSFGLLGGNNNNNGGSSSGGVSSGYGVPSGGGVSSGYGAPSSGYGAPSSSYGGGGGGGGYDGGAPVYVYQQGGNDNNGGGGGGLLGGAGGLLAALLPIGGLALLGGLGILAFGSLFPTTTITGRKKRSVNFGNTTTAAQEQQIMLLQNYMNSLELPEMNLHKDMVAKYLECGSGQSYDAPSLHGCLQKLSCILYDDSIGISENEREIANIVIESIMGNEFISKDLKKSIHVAGKKGARSPGSCDLYKCHHHLLPQQFW